MGGEAGQGVDAEPRVDRVAASALSQKRTFVGVRKRTFSRPKTSFDLEEIPIGRSGDRPEGGKTLATAIREAASDQPTPNSIAHPFDSDLNVRRFFGLTSSLL